MINIFIGTEPKTELARKVLECSILRHSTLPKENFNFVPMMGDNWVKRSSTYLGTGFSLLRWSIPERMNYQGYAIYLDADIIALGDIKELYECDMFYPNEKCSTWGIYRDGPSGRRFESSVMLIDCARAKTNQPNLDASVQYIERDRTRTNYKKIMWAMKHKNMPQQIPSRFNRLNDPSPVEDCVLLHYTIERKQPWYNPNHPHLSYWEDELRYALDCGYVQREEVREMLDKYIPFKDNERGYGMHPYWEKVLL